MVLFECVILWFYAFVCKVCFEIKNQSCLCIFFVCVFCLNKCKKKNNSIYGKKKAEWDTLAEWMSTNRLHCTNVRWMIQVPRIYYIFKKNGIVNSFEDMIANIFEPLFEVTLNPASHPNLHVFLQMVVGFDSVDDGWLLFFYFFIFYFFWLLEFCQLSDFAISQLLFCNSRKKKFLFFFA